MMMMLIILMTMILSVSTPYLCFSPFLLLLSCSVTICTNGKIGTFCILQERSSSSFVASYHSNGGGLLKMIVLGWALFMS